MIFYVPRRTLPSKVSQLVMFPGEGGHSGWSGEGLQEPQGHRGSLRLAVHIQLVDRA